MKNKLSWIMSLIMGILLLAAAVAVPAYKTVNADIIGGAGWPTFWFYFRQTGWLANSGVGLCAVSLIALWIRKK